MGWILTALWLLTQFLHWASALSRRPGSETERLRQLTSQTESRWAWRLTSLSDSLPATSWSHRLLSFWASLVTPTQLASFHSARVDAYLLHFALTLGSLIAFSILAALGSLAWLWRRGQKNLPVAGPAIGWIRVWVAYVSWNFLTLLALAGVLPACLSGLNRTDALLDTFAVVLLLGLMCAVLGRPNGWRFSRGGLMHFRWSLVWWGLCGYGLAFPVVFCLGWLQSRVSSSVSGNSMIALVAESNPHQLVILLWMAALLTPVVEEFWYRANLLEALRPRLGDRRALVVSALLFSFVHADPGAVLALFGLGLIFGMLYLRTGSLWPGVIAHGLWNATSFFLVRLAVV